MATKEQLFQNVVSFGTRKGKSRTDIAKALFETGVFTPSEINTSFNELDKMGIFATQQQGPSSTPQSLATTLNSFDRSELNESQNKALGFGRRMNVSGEILSSLENKIAEKGILGSIEQAIDERQVGTTLFNRFVGKDFQKFDQARRDFITAKLRRESGAAIAESEFKDAEKQYFPVPGDSTEVVEQKRKNRELVTRDLFAEAGVVLPEREAVIQSSKDNFDETMTFALANPDDPRSRKFLKMVDDGEIDITTGRRLSDTGLERSIFDDVKEAAGDVGEFATGVFEAGRERFGRAKEAVEAGVGIEATQTPIESGVQVAGQVTGLVGDIVGEGVVGLGKLLLTGEEEERVAETIKNTLETETGRKAVEAFKAGAEQFEQFRQENPRAARNLEAVGNIVETMADFLGFGVAKKGLRPVKELAEKVVVRGAEVTAKETERVGRGIGQLFGRKVEPIQSTEDLVSKADEIIGKDPEAAAKIRGRVEAEKPRLTIKEKFAGIKPDIKKRIAGKHEELKEYFDTAHSSVLDDTLPTVFDLANAKVEETSKLLNKAINEVGSEIGKARKKISGIRVSSDDARRATDVFDAELEKLNLEIDKGKIKQITGKPVVIGSGEIKTLQTLRENLELIKQNPTIDNVLENRFIFDDRINFAKRSGEVSGAVDPMARKIRGTLADINAKTVGKQNAKDLEKYSLAKQAQKELSGFVDKRAGSEFLLRLALSGRGREARDIIRTIKEITGKDLMDDANFLQITTELISNDRTKNLFRKEIERAGLDVASAITGGKVGAINFIFEKAKQSFVDTEKQLLITAKRKK